MTPRALAPDLARGYMLLLIAVANISIYLWAHDGIQMSIHPTDGTALDTFLAVLVTIFIDGRVYPMFAFLFGYGIVQFINSRYERGLPIISIRKMLWRRHWWLIVFGAVHALLLFAGDILGAYGVAGLALAWMFFSAQDRSIKIASWILAGLITLSAVVGLVLAPILHAFVPGETLALMTGGGADAPSQADILTGQAHYGLAALTRIGYWAAGVFGTLIILVVPLCIMLGGLAARHRWLERDDGRPALTFVAIAGITIGVLGGIPQALLYLDVLPLHAGAWVGLPYVTAMTGAAGGIGYAALFARIALRARRPVSRVHSAVAAVGKRSLTFYLLQSLVFAPLLSAWGLGLGAQIGTATAFAIAAATWLISVGIAVALEQRGARGPAEMLLRRLTYGTHDPQGASLR